MSDVAARVYEATGEAFQRRSGPLLLPLVEALTAALASADAAVQPTEGGWPALFDLDATPDPWWLARLMGARLPEQLTAEQARDYVRSRPGWMRGTPSAIRAAAAAVYGGRVTLIERDGSPWRLTIQLYGSEATPADVERVRAAVQPHKPAGIVLNVVAVTGATYAHMTAEHTPYTDFADDFPTYDDATWHLPEGGTTP